MKYKILPLLSLFALSFTACQKEDPVAKIAGKETLMSQDWKYHDIKIEQDLSYSMFGMSVDFDTTYSPFKDMPTCRFDYTIRFLEAGKFDYSVLDSYCGEDLVQPSDASWNLNTATSEFTLIGNGMAGMVSDGTNLLSLGDTAIYKVIELTDKSFIFEYEMNPAAIMESLGMGDLGNQFPVEIKGTSKFRVTMIGQ